jgi:hypothetical protein
MAASTYRVKHQIKVLASVDENERLIGLNRQEDVTTTVVRDDLTQAHNETRAVAPNVTDQALAFGAVATAKILYMETDQELTMKINGGSEVFKLTPTTGAKAKLFWEGEFTAITVSNASTTEIATLTYHVSG